MMIVFICLVMLASTECRRLNGPKRRRIPQVSPARQLLYLKQKLDMCNGKFLCDANTNKGSCNVDCISLDKVCNGQMDCKNGIDEIGCSSSTSCPECEIPTQCPEPEVSTPCPTPEMSTPCPTPEMATPCPARECPVGEVRCRNGEMCVPTSVFCDGENNCGDGDDTDESPDYCPKENCIPNVDNDRCINGDINYATLLENDLLTISLAEGGDCAKVCNAVATCTVYIIYQPGPNLMCSLFDATKTFQTDALCPGEDEVEIYDC